MDEENKNRLLRIADRILQDLDREIKDLPKEQVWYCKSQNAIKLLLEHLEDCLCSYYQALSGTQDATREMLKKLIKITKREKEAAEAVYFSLNAKNKF